MKPHQFKIIYSIEEDVYRILDLTDTAIVGITEMYKNDDDIDKAVRVDYTKEIKSKTRLGAKIVGYGIFVFLDDYNMKVIPSDEDYLRAVLQQMAKYFAQEVIDEEPIKFKDYVIPQRKNASPIKKDSPQLPLASEVLAKEEAKESHEKKLSLWDRIKQLTGWRLGVLLFLLIILVGVLFYFIMKTAIGDVLEIVFGIPFMIILALAYIGDLLRR